MSMTLYKNLFNDPFFGWDKDFYRFDRKEKDLYPYSIREDKEKGIILITHNVLGIDKKDLNVSIKPENGRKYLVIEGSTIDEVNNKEYTINSRFFVPNKYDVTKLKATSKNGLVYIELPYKKEVLEEEKEIKINVE